VVKVRSGGRETQKTSKANKPRRTNGHETPAASKTRQPLKTKTTNAPHGVRVNRKYKDAIFQKIFNNPTKCLTLYNAVNGTHHTDASAVRMTTLDSALYMKVRNDVSCLFQQRLSLFEQQSTVNPNMPYRMLRYVIDVLRKIEVDERPHIYGRNPIKIPCPQFVVFYNGTEDQPECQTYRLSDLFDGEKEIDPQMELSVTVYNINPPNNTKLVEACPDLLGYVKFIERIRENLKTMSIEDAVDEAIDYCIEHDYLAEFLSRCRAEVYDMCLYFYDEEYERKMDRQEAKEEGREEGFAEGHKEGLEEGLVEGRKEGRKEGREEGLAEGSERERQQGIHNLIMNLRDVGLPHESVKFRVMATYNLTSRQADKHLQEFETSTTI